MGLMSETVAHAVIPAAAAVGILFALLQWFMVSKVSVSGGSREKENLMGDEEDDVDDDAVVLKCAEIHNAISVENDYSFSTKCPQEMTILSTNALKDLDDSDMLTVLIQEMSKTFPTLMETLLNERDMYMSTRLFNVTREHSSVVTIVGRGHLAGIKKHWKQPVEG